MEIPKNIKLVPFKGEYFPQIHPKNQVYLHHTAGAAEGEATFRGWDNDKAMVATCVCISRNGDIVQGFPSNAWAWHLGLAQKHFAARNLPYKELNKNSIGIEICSWGSLKKTDKGYQTWAGTILPEERVEVLDKPFRGSLYYERYTDAQIKSVVDLIHYWAYMYKLDLSYKEDIWDICDRALEGKEGLYSHASVRPDKSDAYPCPRLIAALKALV